MARGSRSASASNPSAMSEVSGANHNRHRTKPVPVPTKPSLPPNIPSTDEQWNNFFARLDHDEADEPPSSSMISFVLSNLRVGVDLSKMPLPTWFLQKRSILEAYSDFFRHTDEFIKISKATSPEARMLQCFRWFIIGFKDHFYKLTHIAKKPFNSILGETFNAEFVVDSNCNEKNVNSPWPWTSTNNVTFFAEQVSHHPPVSAFYAECPSARMCVNCHLMVVAKFRGLHVKAKNHGSLNVTLVDQGEEYVITMPNGFGRSLLTTPWVEAGGVSTITCAKTRYSMEIEFFTKSLFSSERNKIKAKLMGPHTPTPKDATLFEGHWDTQIFKAPTGKGSKGHGDLWLDTSRQSVRPLVSQPFANLPENDSRKVWREVAWCIKSKIQDKADDFKAYVENVQRREQYLRDQSGGTWTPVWFQARTSEINKKTGAMPWDFKHPLSRRHQQRSAAESASASASTGAASASAAEALPVVRMPVVTEVSSNSDKNEINDANDNAADENKDANDANNNADDVNNNAAELGDAEAGLADAMGEYKDAEARLEDATLDNEDAGPGVEDAMAGNEDTEAGLEDATVNYEDAGPGVEDAKAGNEDAEAGLEDATVNYEDAGPEMEDAKAGNEDAGAGLEDAKAEFDVAEPNNRKNIMLEVEETLGQESFDAETLERKNAGNAETREK